MKINSDDFNEFSDTCRYGEWGIKEYSRSEFEWTCRNKHNLTLKKRSSWGRCDYNNCPLIDRECDGGLFINGKKVADITSYRLG
jgi:hypothetical protein